MKLNASSNSGAICFISKFQQPCISFSKMAGLRAKQSPKSVCNPVLCGLVCHLDKQTVKAPGLLILNRSGI